jgi:type I restriction enzyme M protein
LITDFSKPSVLWGIDGDWMVNYIPENTPYYPTDHCGVVRLKTNDINARFLSKALFQVGEEKRFSRSHRASIDRIKGLIIRIPTIEIQNEFATKIEFLERKINDANLIIEKIKEEEQTLLKKYLI